MASSNPARLFCIDVGNTFVKAAVGDGRRWTHFRPLPTGRLGNRPPWHGRGVDDVAAVVVSSVVPRANRRVAAAARRATGRAVWFVDHRWRFPFRLAVPSPAAVGVDRLCAALGAMRYGARAAIVVDMGSAITVDLVSRGAYRGGLIMAGPDLGLRALGEFAAQLPEIDFWRESRDFTRPRDGTRSSMLLGAGYGTVGAIKEAVAYLLRESPGRPRVFLTGGGGNALRRRLPKGWIHRPDLVMEGLYVAGRSRLLDFPA